MHIKIFALVCLTWSLYFWYLYHLWLYKIIYLFNHIFHTEKLLFIFLLYRWSSLLLFMHFQVLIFEMRHQSRKNIQPSGTMVIVEYCISIFLFVPCFFPNSLNQPISYLHHAQGLSSLKEVGKNHTHSKQHFWELFWRDCTPTCSSLGSPLVDTTSKSAHPSSSQKSILQFKVDTGMGAHFPISDKEVLFQRSIFYF